MGVVAGLLLLGLAASAAEPPPSQKTSSVVDILPMLDVRRCRQDGSSEVCTSPSAEAAAAAYRAPNAYIGGYTRFVIEEETPAGEQKPRDYDSEDRGWLRRVMSARSLTRVLSIRTVLARPNVSTTTTLMTANQESNSRQGESWTTEQNERLYLTPYFRVSPTSSSTVEVSLNASSAIQGEVTGMVIGMLKEGSKLVAPASTLITSASEARLVQASDYLSNTVSRLFSQTLSEKRSVQFGPGEWGGQSLVIEARLPSHRRISGDEAELIGRWRVMAEPAVVSIFNPVPYCPEHGCDELWARWQAEEAFQGLSPQSVLNFDLDGAQSVVQAIRSDPAVARALDALARVAPETAEPPNDGETAPASARRTQTDQSSQPAARTAAILYEGLSPERRMAVNVLCNVIAAKAESLGFNRFDVAAIVWAVGHSDVVSNNDGSALIHPDNCISSAQAFYLALPARPNIQPDQGRNQTGQDNNQTGQSNNQTGQGNNQTGQSNNSPPPNPQQPPPAPTPAATPEAADNS